MRLGNSQKDSLIDIFTDILPKASNDIRIDKFRLLPLQGQSTNMFSFTVSYDLNNETKRKLYILRIYKHKTDDRCKCESLLSGALGRCNFRVPEIYHFEEYNTPFNARQICLV